MLALGIVVFLCIATFIVSIVAVIEIIYLTVAEHKREKEYREYIREFEERLRERDGDW